MIGGSTALPFDVVKKFQVGRKRPNRRPAQNDLKIARNTYLDLKCWSRSHYLNAYNQEHAWAPAGTLQLSLLLVLIPSAARIYQWFAWEAFSKFPTCHLDLFINTIPWHGCCARSCKKKMTFTEAFENACFDHAMNPRSYITWFTGKKDYWVVATLTGQERPGDV